jgi:hypothetical protein
VNLPEELLALLRQPSTCFLATLMPDGSPQMTETWVDTDGEHVVINTVQGHQKVRNVERDPRVAVSVCDPANPSRYYSSAAGSSISLQRAAPSTSKPFPSDTTALPTRGTAAVTKSASFSPSGRTKSTGWGERALAEFAAE